MESSEAIGSRVRALARELVVLEDKRRQTHETEKDSLKAIITGLRLQLNAQKSENEALKARTVELRECVEAEEEGKASLRTTIDELRKELEEYRHAKTALVDAQLRVCIEGGSPVEGKREEELKEDKILLLALKRSPAFRARRPSSFPCKPCADQGNACLRNVDLTPAVLEGHMQGLPATKLIGHATTIAEDTTCIRCMGKRKQCLVWLPPRMVENGVVPPEKRQAVREAVTERATSFLPLEFNAYTTNPADERNFGTRSAPAPQSDGLSLLSNRSPVRVARYEEERREILTSRVGCNPRPPAANSARVPTSTATKRPSMPRYADSDGFSASKRKRPRVDEDLPDSALGTTVLSYE